MHQQVLGQDGTESKPLLHIDVGLQDIEVILGVNGDKRHRVVHMMTLKKAISSKTMIKGEELAMLV